MGASARCSNSARVGALFLALSAAAGAGCVEKLPPITGTTSLSIEVTTPSDLGSPENRLDDSARSITFNATAVSADGEVDTGFSGTISVYAHYLGSLTPGLDEEALATAEVVDGVTGDINLDLPLVYGSTFLWVEHSGGGEPTFATGTSDTLYFRDPFLADVSRPLDEAALDALEASPLEEKQVVISSSRYGDRGRLVVTGVYAQGYTVSDSECQDSAGTPPCVTGDYDHIFVFTFSRAEIEGGGIVLPGQFVDEVSGAITEFVGLTEIGFPSTAISDQTADEAAIPAPRVVEQAWLDDPIQFERAEAALVAVEGATVCPLDETFEEFSQWKLDVGRGCGGPGDVVSVISEGVVPDFNPGDHVGEVLPRVVGTLRPVNTAGGNFNVWIIFPRGSADVVAP